MPWDDLLIVAALVMRLVVRQLLEPISLELAFGLYLAAMLVLLPVLVWRMRRSRAALGLTRGDLAGSLRATALLLPFVLAQAAANAWQLTGRLALAPLWLVSLALLNGLVTAALPEEVLFRGVLLARLRRAGASPWRAVVVQGALFAAGHVRYPLAGQWLLFGNVTVLGLLLGWLALRYRTLAGPIVLHTLSNAATFALLGGTIQRL